MPNLNWLIILNRKKIIKLLFIIIFTTILYPINSHCTELDDSYLSILALNYCHYSLTKIIEYNDRIILDEEYNEIINNIDLTRINDEEIIEILKKLMDVLTEFKLDERSKERFYRLYQSQVETAMYRNIANITSGNFKMQSTKKNISEKSEVDKSGSSEKIIQFIKKGFSLGTQFAAAQSLLKAGTAYASYRTLIEDYRNNFEDNVWELDNNAIKRINEINKTFLETYWRLLKKYNAPDNWRLTIDQLKTLIEASKEKDENRYHRKIVRLEKDFTLFPPYWYYRAAAAYNASVADDAKYAIAQFEKSRKGFFRVDNFLSNTMMIKVQLTDYTGNIENLISDLTIIRESSRNDLRKTLFIGLTLAQYGLLENAEKALQECLDNDWNVSIVNGFMAQIKFKNMNVGQMNKHLKGLLQDNITRNQDILLLVGSIPKNLFLNNFVKQISEINLLVEEESLIGKDDVTLCMPTKWVLDDPKMLNAIIEFNDERYRFDEIKIDKDKRITMFIYKDIIDQGEIFDNIKQVPVKIHIATKAGIIRITGNFEQKSRKIEKSSLSKTASETTSYLKSKVGLGDDKEKEADPFTKEIYTGFKMQSIRPNNLCFAILDDNKFVQCPQESN